MELLNKYPASKAEFVNWLIIRFGLPIEVFNESSETAQCNTIIRCFGYAKQYEEGENHAGMIDFTENVLYLYQEIRNKYPNGPPDFLMELKQMDFTQRSNLYPWINAPADITHGINEAIIDLPKSSVFVNTMKSIRDAIINFIPPKAPERDIMDVSFITANWLNERKNETVPF